MMSTSNARRREDRRVGHTTEEGGDETRRRVASRGRCVNAVTGMRRPREDKDGQRACTTVLATEAEDKASSEDEGRKTKEWKEKKCFAARLASGLLI